MDTILTLAEIEEVTEAYESARTRGEYKPAIVDFFKSGELALNCTKRFPGKESASLRNSITQNAEKVEDAPTFKVILTKGVEAFEDGTVLLINLDAMAAAKAEADDTVA